METTLQHPAYEILNNDWELMEIALLVEQMQGDVDYHNFDHPLDVLANTKNIADKYEQNYPEAPKLNRRRLYRDALLHDVLVSEPLDTSIFPTNEHRSAYIAGDILDQMGASQTEIAEIQSDIISTNPNYPSQDKHSLVLVMADIGNISGPFPEFVNQFIKVYKEKQRSVISQEGLSALANPEDTVEPSIGFLSLYFRQDLSLGEKDKTDDGTCRFVADALCNFAKIRGISQLTWAKVKKQFLSELQ